MSGTDSEGIRLNKYIASSGLCSRREADTLIENGKVTINGGRYEVKYAEYIYTSCGYLIINSGTFVGSTAAIQSSFSSSTYAAYYHGAEATLNGGVFIGNVQTNKDAKASITINAGDFTQATIGEDGIIDNR